MVNKFDTQFLIEGSNLDEDDIRAGIMASAEGDCLIVVGDEEVVKVHYHTDTPWKVPKEKMFSVMAALNTATLQAPVHTGDVVLPNVCGTGVDVVATRNMEKVE